ncbi:MAG: ABC transporter substrate-binding protein [Lachnospiraceae bacterium]|nr:ABC transporter substrate-binding protein [Lachnospiraceae bacterium]
MKKKISLLLISVLVIGTLAGCGNSKQAETSKQQTENTVTVKIGYLPITHALAIFEEKELLDQENKGVKIELQKFSSWTDLTDALNSGQIDGASVLIELAMNAVSQGIDLKAVALGHKDGNVIVVSDKIKDTADLKGKTFAIPSNQSSHNILLNDMLNKAGMSTSDVNITQLSPSEMPSSLASGAIDGYCVAEPFGAQAVVQGYGHVLYQSEDLWENSLCCAFVLNNSFIKEQAAAADTIIAEYTNAGSRLDETTAITVAENYLGQDEETLKESLKWIHYDDLAITKEDYEVLTEKMVNYKINENPPSYEAFVYTPQ